MKGNDSRLWQFEECEHRHVPLHLAVEEDKGIYTATFQTNMGDSIEVTSYSLPELLDIVETWRFFSHYDIAEGKVIPKESQYWTMHKRGKLKKNDKVKLNGKVPSFIAPEYYYRDKEAVVYKLEYLGVIDKISWTSDYIAKWSQEAQYYAQHGADPANMEFTVLYTAEDAKKVLAQVDGNTKYLDSLVLEVFAKYTQKKLGKSVENCAYVSKSLNYPNGKAALPQIEKIVEEIVEKSM